MLSLKIIVNKQKQMESKNLRIGNLVKNGRGIYEVIALSEDNVLCKSADGIIIDVPITYEPIILTKQMLLKYGFILSGDTCLVYDQRDRKRIFIELGSNMNKNCGDGYLNADTYYTLDRRFELRYLHELQNYYHVFNKVDLPKNNHYGIRFIDIFKDMI